MSSWTFDSDVNASVSARLPMLCAMTCRVATLQRSAISDRTSTSRGTVRRTDSSSAGYPWTLARDAQLYRIAGAVKVQIVCKLCGASRAIRKGKVVAVNEDESLLIG